MKGKLTAKEVENFKPAAKVYRKADGGGLYLQVEPNGSKLWRFKYRYAGKEKKMALGAFDEVSLAQARIKHEEARATLRKELDPMAERMVEKVAGKEAAKNSLKAVGLAWHAWWKPKVNDDTAEVTMRRLKAEIFSPLGSIPISEIRAPQLVALIERIEARGVQEAPKRVLNDLKRIFRWAERRGIIESNPTSAFVPAETLKPTKSKNFARVSTEEVPALMQAIAGYLKGGSNSRSKARSLAMQLLPHTMVRTSELLEGRWEEIDWEAKTWTIPKEHMKTIKLRSGEDVTEPHVVPLAEQTLALFRQLHALNGKHELMFPGQYDKTVPVTRGIVTKGLRLIGYEAIMTGHGFRGMATTILKEHGFTKEVVDLQLSHMSRKKTDEAYDKSRLLVARRIMMQWWADYLEAATKGEATPEAVLEFRPVSMAAESNVLQFPRAS